MKYFDKSHKLDNVAYDVRGPVLDQAILMEKAGDKILKLNIGNPAAFGYKAPEHLLRRVSENLARADGYSESMGIMEARSAIVGWCAKKGIDGVDEDDIYTGNGVSELIALLAQGLLDSGDELMLPTPDYPLWTAATSLAGGTPVHYICDYQNGWYPDLSDMERKISPRTKGIVVINPNNPTGALYPREILEGIVSLARKYGLILFADEIYDSLVFDGKEHVALASLAPDLFCVTLGGLSKSHRAAGFRIGWLCLSGDKSRAKGYIEGIKMLSSMRLCSNVPAQFAVAPALSDGGFGADMLPGGSIYERREAIYTAINDIPGVSAVKPEAAFYIFPRMDPKRFNIIDDERFALDFLRAKNVLIVHGKGFNYGTPGFFRIVFLPEPKDLRRAAEGLRSFLETYRQG